MANLRKTCPRPKGCGTKFTPRRGTRRIYCYACRPESTQSGPRSQPAPRALPTNGEMAAAVRAELERLEQVGTVAGAIALRLARSLDDPSLGAAQVSSVSAQLTRTLEPLQKRGPREPSVLDEFTRRIHEKQASA